MLIKPVISDGNVGPPDLHLARIFSLACLDQKIRIYFPTVLQYYMALTNFGNLPGAQILPWLETIQEFGVNLFWRQERDCSRNPMGPLAHREIKTVPPTNDKRFDEPAMTFGNSTLAKWKKTGLSWSLAHLDQEKIAPRVLPANGKRHQAAGQTVTQNYNRQLLAPGRPGSLNMR